MKKLLLVGIAIICSSAFVYAQYALEVSYQLGIPGKQMYSSDMKTSLIGVNGKLKYSYDDYLKIAIGVGYYQVPFEKLRIDETQIPVSDLNLTLIPVTIGGEFYFLSQDKSVEQKIKPFIGLDLGWVLAMQPESDYTAAKNRNNLIIAPTFGIAYKLTDNLDVFGAARQNVFIYEFRDFANYNSTFSMFGLNVGINYQF